MRHDITVEKYGVRLRPVEIHDANFIVKLRNSSHAIGNIGDTAPNKEIQIAWINNYFERENDYYFIVESTKSSRAVGTVGVYDVVGNTGEWGRWVVLPGIPAGPASAWLTFHICFDVLGLENVLGHVVATNSHVISFHERIGNPRTGSSFHPEPVGSQIVEMVDYWATRKDWQSISLILSKYATLAEKILLRDAFDTLKTSDF